MDSAKDEIRDAGDGHVSAEDVPESSEPPPDDAEISDEAAGDQVSPAAQKWKSIQHARVKKQKKQRPFWIELPILLAIAFVMTFLIQTFFFKVYYIPSGSMEQTLHGVADGGDRVLVNKIVYDFSDPTPGEVVVFRGPPTWAVEASIPGPTSWYGKFFSAVGSVIGIAPPNEKDYVKRVIATSGQTVQCCDAEGNVMVDGQSLDEPYIYEDLSFSPGTNDCTGTEKSQRCFGPIVVPPDSLWMMGDHRSQSKDSTWGCRGSLPGATCQGPIPTANVIGKAIFVVLPVSRWQVVDDPKIQSGSSQALPMVGGLLGAVSLRGGSMRRRRRRRLGKSRCRQPR